MVVECRSDKKLLHSKVVSIFFSCKLHAYDLISYNLNAQIGPILLWLCTNDMVTLFVNGNISGVKYKIAKDFFLGLTKPHNSESCHSHDYGTVGLYLW